ncbi:MAG: rhodanese-like domain-containing protein [Legionellaceae bacterium]|nr:rhodanese-like domain-containing protein [Legionellaceae bacterium]
MEHFSQFTHNHWQLSVALVVIFIAIFIYEYVALQKQGKTLTPEAAIVLMNHENAVVFDLRTAELFKGGHIIDSIRASDADFNLPKMDKYKSKLIILVCARGVQSAALAVSLRAKGFTQPMVLAGGIAAWQSASLPLVKK